MTKVYFVKIHIIESVKNQIQSSPVQTRPDQPRTDNTKKKKTWNTKKTGSWKIHTAKQELSYCQIRHICCVHEKSKQWKVCLFHWIQQKLSIESEIVNRIRNCQIVRNSQLSNCPEIVKFGTFVVCTKNPKQWKVKSEKCV